MTARTKGLASFSANFETQMAAPLDARMLCDTKADLLLATTWEANDGGHYAYVGMLVTVNGDSTSANNGVYRLTALPYTSAGNWERCGSSADAPAIAEIAFAYGDATPRTIYTTIGTQRVWQVLLSIDTPFNGTAPALTIGDAGDADRLMTATQNDPKTADVYSTQPAYEYSDGTAITLSITPGAGASAGSGKIQLFF
jgi:hypothetical protein